MIATNAEHLRVFSIETLARLILRRKSIIYITEHYVLEHKLSLFTSCGYVYACSTMCTNYISKAS